MPGALLDLVAIGPSTTEYMNRHSDQVRRSVEMTSSKFNRVRRNTETGHATQECSLIRNADQVIPHSILVKNPQQFHLKKLSFVFEPNNTVVSFDSYFYDTYPALKQETEQSIRYSFPVEDYRLDTLCMLVALTYTEVKMRLEYTGQCDEIKVFHSYVYMDTGERREIVRTPFEREIIQTQTQPFTIDQLPDDRTHTIRLRFSELTNGYYLTGVRKEDLASLKLILNNEDQDRIAWEEDELESFATQMGDSVWIPLNNRPLYDFSHALNQSHIDTMVLQFTFKQGVTIPPVESQRYAVWCNVWNLVQFSTGYINLLHGSMNMNPMASTFVFPSESSPPTEEPSEEPGVRQYRPITATDVECPITQQPITSGEEYYTCHQCNHPFSRDGYRQWLQTNNSCPLCRTGDQSLHIMYLNEQEPDEVRIEPLPQVDISEQHPGDRVDPNQNRLFNNVANFFRIW